MECLFCKMVSGEISVSKVFENEYVLAFDDINPVAPVHTLIIPKVHIKDMNEINEENAEYLKQIGLAVKEVAKIKGISDSGYKIISNTGRDGGQEVPHLHFHLIGGKKIKNTISFE